MAQALQPQEVLYVQPPTCVTPGILRLAKLLRLVPLGRMNSCSVTVDVPIGNCGNIILYCIRMYKMYVISLFDIVHMHCHQYGVETYYITVGIIFY